MSARATALLALFAAAGLAMVAAFAVAGEARRREATVSPWPAADNPGPRGLMAARAFLLESGRAVSRRGPGDPAAPAATIVLAAPRAALSAPEVDELLSAARAGATVVYARGGAPQLALEARLGLSAGGEAVPPLAHGLAPHPLTGDLALPAGGPALRSSAPGALAVSGAPGRTSGLSVPFGRGEVLVLSDPSPLENARLDEGDAVSLLLRLGHRGPVVLDERFLAPPAGAPRGLAQALAPAAAQLLLAALALFWARGRRLGAIRPPPAGTRRTARDYLASLAALYGGAGAEAELAGRTWERLRDRLAGPAGVPRGLSDAEAARRLVARAPGAAEALLRGAAARARGGREVLLAVAQAAADVERGVTGVRPPSGAPAGTERARTSSRGDPRETGEAGAPP